LGLALAEECFGFRDLYSSSKAALNMLMAAFYRLRILTSTRLPISG
jgi:hypothetical protein